MPFVDDTFTDTSGTLLTGHVGETGATWTKHPDLAYAAGTPQISDANRLRGGAVGTTEACYASGVPAGAEYDVEGPLRCVSVVGSFAITGRMDTAADTMYQGQRNAGASWRLLKRVAGTATVLASTASAAPTVGASQQVKLEIRNATKKLYVGGVELLSSTDNAITAAGRAGIWDGGSASNTTGFHLDRITASDAAVTVAAVVATTTASAPTPTAILAAQPASAPATAAGPTPTLHVFAQPPAAEALAQAQAAVDAAIGLPAGAVTATAGPPGWGLGLGPPPAEATAASPVPEARVLVLAPAGAASAQEDPPGLDAAIAALAATITAAGDPPGALIVVIPPAGVATAIGGLPLFTIPAEHGLLTLTDAARGTVLVSDAPRGALALTDTPRGAALVVDSG